MVPLKIAYGDDIRKIYVENITVASLHEHIQSMYTDLQAVPFSDLFVYYLDDENDKIRIKLDLELTEALRQHEKSSHILKIFVQKLDSPATSINSSPTTPSTAAAGLDVSQLAPFLGMLNNVAPMLLNNPIAMQQMASMLPTMMPFINSIFNPNNAATNAFSSPSFTPFAPIVSPSVSTTTTECGSSASPSCTSVSTETLIDAKDVATETALCGVAQTTQTQQQNPTHQTTQTNLNATSATQTAQGASNTQTTQTNANATCATQTAQEQYATQTAQTQTAQAQAQAQVTCETQTQQAPPEVNFYESLAGTQFGGFLEQLRELGFTDREKCVQALVKNGGKLPEAIDELLLDQLLE